MKKYFLLAALCLAQTFLMAQNQLLPTPRNIQKAYLKETRSTSGKPGPKYWQNTAMYSVAVEFEPTTRLLKGVANINYKNNSPDTLRELVFKIYPNIYKKGGQRNMAIEDTADVTNGMEIEWMLVNGDTVASNKRKTNGTNMSVVGTTVKPKANAEIKIAYSYVLNKQSHIRQGQVDSGAFFIAYYFPRVAVYDDVDGWNRLPYLGPQEFYNDFCNFDLNITVPEDYVVLSTGDLMNCREVMEGKFCDRIAQAEQSSMVRYIIDSTDIANGNITKKGKNTWHYVAQNVTDVAFGISNHYLWQSSSVLVDSGASKRRTRVEAVFNKAHKDYFFVQDDAAKTVHFMSHSFPKWPFPYNHMTVFDGLDQMEYPMMANDNPVEDRAESIELTIHEIFHTMFPFYMGTNETKYGWMDEGWATIGEWLITPMIDSSIVDRYGIDRTSAMMGTEHDMPIATTLTTHTTGMTAFANNYPKPGLAYLYLKDMLGDELFLKGLHHYIKNWNGRHPLPNDFFYSMNAGTGKNLNWYWKKWFFENGVVDLAIESMTQKGSTRTLLVKSIGDKPAPILAEVTFADGTKTTIHKSAAVWEKSKLAKITFSSSKKVTKVELRGDHFVDADFTNNTWISK